MNKYLIVTLGILILVSCNKNPFGKYITDDYIFSGEKIIINVPAMNERYHFCSNKIQYCSALQSDNESEYTCKYGTWVREKNKIKFKYTKSIEKKELVNQ